MQLLIYYEKCFVETPVHRTSDATMLRHCLFLGFVLAYRAIEVVVSELFS